MNVCAMTVIIRCILDAMVGKAILPDRKIQIEFRLNPIGKPAP